MSRRTNATAVTVAILLATFLAALDVTVVGTAMPTIIGSLGGLDLYSWVFSAYLLTSTTTVPVYGRLADIHGRKPVFAAGAVLFIVGSALCGTATSMEQLILFRAIQGLGAGAVLPVSITIVGDIYTVERRAQVQGLLSSVWAASAILGPALGGIIVDRFDWRWVFYVNLPFGLLSILLLVVYLHETVTHQERAVDYAGAVGLTLAITLLLVGLLDTDQTGGGLPVPPWVLLAASGLVFVAFLRHEIRTKEPLLPLSLLKNRVLSVSYGAGLLIGAVLMGLSSYVPPFVQGVLGGSAVNAGAALAPMSIGWPVGSTLSGRLIMRRGYRPVVLVGMAFILAGSLLMLGAGRASSQAYVMMATAVVGLGMGFGATSTLIAVQSAVGWGQRGVATAFIQFTRSIGGAVGVAVMGALLNNGMAASLPSMDSVASASIMLDPAARANLPGEALEAMRLAFASALHDVYTAVALAAAAGVVVSLLFPRGSVTEHAHRASLPAKKVPSTDQHRA